METESPCAWAHRSVMVAEALAALAPRPGGVYCDATLGAGGHAEQILLRSAPDGLLIGIDRDETALLQAAKRLAPFGDRFIPVHGCFGQIADLLAQKGLDAKPIDGLLADLGVSSMQIDQPARGFSFQQRGPIDMRMDASQGETALQLIDRLDADRLADIVYEYGEERHSRRIAAALKKAAAAQELVDTLALSRTIEQAVPFRDPHKHAATRTFQALRIAVNDELRQIHNLLLTTPRLLGPDGRLAIISFHSLEDRLVKHHFLHGEQWLPLHRRPQSASEAEIADNPRARSARLRSASVNAAAVKLVGDDKEARC